MKKLFAISILTLFVASANADTIYSAKCSTVIRKTLFSYNLKKINRTCRKITNEYNYNCVVAFSKWFGMGEFYKGAAACKSINTQEELRCVREVLATSGSGNSKDMIESCSFN